MKRSREYSTRQAMQRKMAEEIHVADLVEVMEFYPDDMTVDVKPLVMAAREDRFISRPPVLKVPAAMLGSRDFFIRPWYKAGDLGFIVYLDYDSDNAFASGEESEPLTTGCHTGKDGIFIGGVICGETSMEGIPEETIAIGAGENYMAFGKDGITIHGKMELEGELKVNGKRVMLAE